jgi:Nickel responsive protein SCO4226-like
VPLFLIERNFAERLELDGVMAREITRVNDDVGVRWLYSFLSADAKKTYCLYEAPSAEAIRDAARRLGMPADTIVECSRISAEVFA